MEDVVHHSLRARARVRRSLTSLTCDDVGEAERAKRLLQAGIDTQARAEKRVHPPSGSRFHLSGVAHRALHHGHRDAIAAHREREREGCEDWAGGNQRVGGGRARAGVDPTRRESSQLLVPVRGRILERHEQCGSRLVVPLQRELVPETEPPRVPCLRLLRESLCIQRRCVGKPLCTVVGDR